MRRKIKYQLSKPHTINSSPSTNLNIDIGTWPAPKYCQFLGYNILSFMSWGSRSLCLTVLLTVILFFNIHFTFLFGWFQVWIYVLVKISVVVIEKSWARGVHDPVFESWALVAQRIVSIRSKKFPPLCFNLDIQWVEMRVLHHTIFFNLVSFSNLGLKLHFFHINLFSYNWN